MFWDLNAIETSAYEINGQISPEVKQFVYSEIIALDEILKNQDV